MESNRRPRSARLLRALAAVGLLAVAAVPALVLAPTATVQPMEEWPFTRVAESARLRAGLSAVEPGGVAVIRFSLGEFRGDVIFPPGAPASSEIGCASRTTFTTPTAGAHARGTLTYDAQTDVYSYLWATSASWSGTCRRLSLELADGSAHHVLVWFGEPFGVATAADRVD